MEMYTLTITHEEFEKLRKDEMVIVSNSINVDCENCCDDKEIEIKLILIRRD